MSEVLVITGLSEGEKARLTRLYKWWRQIDVAVKAGTTVLEVINVEKDRWVTPERKARILKVLGLDGSMSEGEDD